MVLPQLRRVRWAVRATLVLGVAASVVANILHALDNPISQAIAAWPPLALLLTVELISRVPVHRRSLAFARLLATATIAGIAAWVSYWHMAGVAARYGETGASAYLLPLSVDGLIVVASICLVELGGQISALEAASAKTARDAAAATAQTAPPAATATAATTAATAAAPATAAATATAAAPATATAAGRAAAPATAAAAAAAAARAAEITGRGGSGPTAGEAGVPGLIPVPATPVPTMPVPALAMPALAVPELAMPELAVPELAMPELAAPELAVPATPRSAMPGSEARRSPTTAAALAEVAAKLPRTGLPKARGAEVSAFTRQGRVTLSKAAQQTPAARPTTEPGTAARKTTATARKTTAKPRRSPAETLEAAAKIKKADPDITEAELASRLGISASRWRTIRREADQEGLRLAA